MTTASRAQYSPQLPSTTHDLIRVEHVGLLMPDDLLAAEGPVILVDAVNGPPAGEIVDMPLGALMAASDAGISPASSHALPLPASLGIVERLGGGTARGPFHRCRRRGLSASARR